MSLHEVWRNRYWNATLLKNDAIEEIKKLKVQPGKSLLQYGVGELTHTMLEQGLVDEFRILEFPFSYGEGPRIFDHMDINTMELLETKTFDQRRYLCGIQPGKFKARDKAVRK